MSGPAPIRTAGDAARLMERRFADARGERLCVAHLGADGRLLRLDQSDGEGSEVALPVRAIVEGAIALGSTSVLIAHNHPGGDPEPSGEDIAATRRLAEAMEPLGIGLRDHLVFGAEACRSFRQLGLL